MSWFTDPTQFEFQAREEEIERWNERRYQARREMACWPEETHCRDEHDYDEANFVPVPAVLTEAGVTPVEAAAFVAWIDRKPVQIERMQMELFPKEVA